MEAAVEAATRDDESMTVGFATPTLNERAPYVRPAVAATMREEDSIIILVNIAFAFAFVFCAICEE
jgi:hypothetical protein